MQMWQIVANLEFVTGFAIDLQTRKPNISPRVYDPLGLVSPVLLEGKLIFRGGAGGSSKD